MSNLDNLKVYFFSGSHYIRVTRGETGAGRIDAGYNPRNLSPIGNGPNFPTELPLEQLASTQLCTAATSAISSKDPDFTEPHPISEWGWPKLPNGTVFGANGINAALWSGPVCYFFSGNQYIHVTRGDDDFGKTDPDYPRSIEAGWGWTISPFVKGIKGALPSGLKCYFFSRNEYIRVSRGLELGGFIHEPGYPAKITAWNWPAGFGANGIDAALYSGGPLQVQPSGGLVSNLNYFLGNGGDALTGITVTINIDNDLISTANGFGFQLNTFSQYIPGTTKAVGQQLIIYSDAATRDLYSWIYIYSGSFEDNTATAGFINIEKSLGVNLPADNTIKAGSSLTFTPIFDPSSSNLLGCNFSYKPAGSSSAFSNQILITDGFIGSTKQKATTADLSPIVTFTLDIVAHYNGQTARLSSGQDTITYDSPAKQPLTASTFNPSYSNIGGTGVHTLESANIIYAGLTASRPIDVSQLFGTTPSVPVDTDIVVKLNKEGMALPLPPRLQATKQGGAEAEHGFGLPLPPHLSGGTQLD